jgi:carboxyl-terminal processing protease
MPPALRLLALPIGALLISAPFRVGFAAPGQMQPPVSPSARQSAPGDSKNAVLPDPRAEQDADVSHPDPVEDYKTALALLKNNYYGQTIDKKKTHQLTYEAIRGLVGSLKDQFSSFLDPDDWTQMQATTEGDFEGVGVILTQEGANVKVVQPIETGPAEKAGLKIDDIMTRVEGASVVGQDLNEVVRRIKGKPGTRAHITVLRGKQLIDMSILRARVEPPVVKYWMEDPQNKIGHILLKEFNRRSVDQMSKALEALQGQGMRALIFDLRYNPGGLLDSAIDVASVFIPQDQRPELHNVVVYMREGSGSEQKRLLGPVETTYTHRVPLVVLVNDNSASASEIVAGAIKDYAVATLIGDRTYGKGRVQTLIPLQDNSCLRLTTQLYYPPRHHDLNFKRDEDGNRIPGTGGIQPDIEVPQSLKWHVEDWKDKANDTQLHAAIDFLRSRLNGETIAQATQRAQQVH